MHINALYILALTCLLASISMAGAAIPSEVPEPGSLIMMGMGIAALALLARKRRKK